MVGVMKTTLSATVQYTNIFRLRQPVFIARPPAEAGYAAIQGKGFNALKGQPVARIIAFSTCNSEESARRIARHLVEARVAACVNIIAGVNSVYRWNGAVEEAAEWMLVIKTRQDRFDALKRELAAVHGYEVPELIAVDIADGLPAYLDWIDRESRLNS
jgi:periplasmic divalent cation tolerance protein